MEIPGRIQSRNPREGDEAICWRVKDGDDDGSVSTPRADPPQPVIRDPALARAMDLLKALAALHPARG